ncbi:MAG: hypothetical protein Q8K92_24100 [Leadbetterella sp.]|nr:hypothetical protein [Leadbetterella sp.]
MIKEYLTCILFFMTMFSTRAQAQSDSLSSARAEILPLFEAMEAAANAHDAEKHVSFYAKEPTLLFVINDRKIKGWDALLEQQRQWWQNGKTDVKYELMASRISECLLLV